MKTITIDGANIHDIPSFYAEINRVFMAGEDWMLGQSLDAFNDMLHGGFGAIDHGEPVRLVWRDFERSRVVLGVEATRTYLKNKLARPQTFNAEVIRKQLDALNAGTGQTYFDILIEIIGEHANIELVRD